MKILDGKALSRQIIQQIALEAREFKKARSMPPGLAILLVGEDPASAIYVRNKIKACESAGFYSVLKKCPSSAKAPELRREIEKLNADKKIHGILVQLPLPSSLKESDILSWVSPQKDADGLTLENKALLWSGAPRVVPCAPQGIISLLKHYEIPLQGQRAAVVGRSQIVGLPMLQQLLAEQATVTVCHSRTQNLSKICRQADIVVACAGKKGLLGYKDFKKGAVAVDVGIHREGKQLCGDIKKEGLEGVLSALSPVPGGIGPMTIAMLLKNGLRLAKLSGA